MDNDLNKLIQLAPTDYRSKVVLGLTIDNYVKLVDTEFPKHINSCDKYGVTKNEFFVYVLLIGGFYSEIQSPLALGYAPNRFITECIQLYDNLLSKMPTTKHQIIYRKEKYFHVEDFKDAFEKKVSIQYKHYLTGSKDDFKGELQLVIKPLPNGKTKAHDVYLIYNHGESSGVTPEYQINFERNTFLLIDKIEIHKDTTYVFCHEI